MRKFRRSVIALCILSVIAACDQDPFGISKRRVSGPYKLQQWEDFRSYYLDGPGGAASDDLLGGTVLSLAWNDRFIAVKRQASFGGDTGWMLVDIEKRQITGPQDSAGLFRKVNSANFTTMSADSAWHRLK